VAFWRLRTRTIRFIIAASPSAAHGLHMFVFALRRASVFFSPFSSELLALLGGMAAGQHNSMFAQKPF
jgi:membrane protein DedA with SNARE-associated domain